MVRIIAQGRFDVNEENIGGAVFLDRIQGASWLFLSDEQLTSISEDQSMKREPLYNTRLLPCHAYLIHEERYMIEHDPLGRFVPGHYRQNF